MTKEERKAEFDRLYESIDGTNMDRIERVCSILFCAPITVRIWRMEKPPRVIPEAKLKILRAALLRLSR